MELTQDQDQEIRHNSKVEASSTLQIDGQRTVGGAPQPSEEQRRWVENLWKETECPSNWEAACKAALYCQQTLHPAWYDLKDPSKGRTHLQLRKREDDRRVRIPIAYMNLQQATAMLVPEGTSSTWTQIPQVRAPDADSSPIAADSTLDRFAKTLEMVVKCYQDEQRYDKIRKGWVRSALSFPIAWLKIYFVRSWAGSPIGREDSGDEQTNYARIESIKQQILDGDIRQGDAEYQELQLLMEGVDGQSELELQEELVIERVKMEDITFPDAVTTFEGILRSPWISHGIRMTVGELRDRFPYCDCEDGTWTGIHPDDLRSLQGLASNTVVDGLKSNPHAMANEATSGDDRTLRVREVHSRENNTITVLVEGLKYHAHQYTPTKTPAQWYMFAPLVLNEVDGSAFGVSDVELCAEAQHRINRKMSDAEKNRFLAIRRYIRDSSTGSQKEIINIANIPPGSVGEANLGGMPIDKILYPLEIPFDPRNYDTSADEKWGRMATRLPEQALGATGNGAADFAAEVNVAAQGATIAIKDRQQTIKGAAADVDKMCAEILLQHLAWEDAKNIGGPHVVWPHIYSEREAKQLYQGILAQCRQEMAPQVIQAYQTDPTLMAGQDAASRTWEIMEAIDRACAEPVRKACIQRFGLPEPMSRESLFKRMQVRVETSMTADLDRRQKNQELQVGIQSVAELKSAFAAAGTPLDIRPLLQRFVGDMSQGDLDSMFPSDVNGAIRQAAQLIQQDPSKADPQLLMQVSQMVAPILQQAQAQQMQQPPQDAPPVAG